jgi:hypothetical protein
MVSGKLPDLDLTEYDEEEWYILEHILLLRQ